MTTPSENYESHDDNSGGYGSSYGAHPNNGDPYASGGQPFGAQSPYGSQQYGSQPFGTQPFGTQSFGAHPFGSQQYGVPSYGTPGHGAMQPYGQPAYGAARKEPALSLVLSFFLPGLGTLINGQTGKGIGIMAGYFLGMVLSIILIGIPIMLGFWVWGMVDGYSGAKNHNIRNGFH